MPLPRTVRGLLAGSIGTATMTAWQELSAKLQSAGSDGDQPAGDAAQAPSDPWEQASVPAQVGRKILGEVFGYDVPVEQIGRLTIVMHWSYGTGWGAVYGLLRGRHADHQLRRGLMFGTAVWAMSYVMLVPAGFYQLPWKYGAAGMAMDVSYHLAYGAGVGTGYKLLRR